MIYCDAETIKANGFNFCHQTQEANSNTMRKHSGAGKYLVHRCKPILVANNACKNNNVVVRARRYVKYIDGAVAYRPVLHSASVRISNVAVGRRSVVKRMSAVQRLILKPHNATLDF